MPLTSDQVRRIAGLARLAVDDETIESTRTRLNDMLGLFTQMQAVDTQGIEPMLHPQDFATRLRDDVASEPDQRDAFQRIAPQTEAGLYLVPKVIE